MCFECRINHACLGTRDQMRNTTAFVSYLFIIQLRNASRGDSRTKEKNSIYPYE
jgi:hypothetical protein